MGDALRCIAIDTRLVEITTLLWVVLGRPLAHKGLHATYTPRAGGVPARSVCYQEVASLPTEGPVRKGARMRRYWYRLLGPVYRLYRRYTDPHIRRYGWHESDCPWCGTTCSMASLAHAMLTADRGAAPVPSGADTVPRVAGVVQCRRCHHRWQVQAQSAGGHHRRQEA
jgi:hypothetical protein